MSGIPYFNFPAFKSASALLRSKGYEVFCPAEHDIERAGRDFSHECPNGTWAELDAAGVPQINYRDCMRIDLNWIIDNADAVALIPGWEDSKGARTEKALAECLNLEIINLA